MPRKPGTSRAKHTLAMMPQVLPAAGVDGPQPVALTGARLQLWNDVRSRFVLEPASENILRNACESLERAAQAAAQVTADGATFRDRFGQIRAHPSVNIERDFRGLAARQLQQLAARMEGQA
jgi:hypothetical protein